MSKSADFIIYTDGGAELGKTAAAAAIIEDVKSGRRDHLVCYLGPGTNNEAEIFAGLIAFAKLRALGETSAKIHWVCDSQYVLQSATQYIHNWQKNGWKTSTKEPVKNQGLWRAYLQLAKGFKIDPEHVRGHTGHPENEACDFATNWTRSNRDIFSKANSSFEEDIDGTPWIVFDAQEIITALREDTPAENIVERLIEIPAGTKVNGDERILKSINAKLAEVVELSKKLEAQPKKLKGLLEAIEKSGWLE